MKPFAAFVLAFDGSLVCGTTRAKDRGEAGKIGLPGGKIDPGETGQQAVKREAIEEGWNVKFVDIYPFYQQIVDGKLVQWFYGFNAVKLKNYKEIKRIKPVSVSIDEIKKSGFGNDNALNRFFS